MIGIISPKIQPLGGLQGYLRFSGNPIYTYSGRVATPCIPRGFPRFFYVSSLDCPKVTLRGSLGYRLELSQASKNFVTINTLGTTKDLNWI